MQKLNPKKAAENPLAAALLGAVLVKNADGDQARERAGLELIRIAEANQDKMPKLKPNSKLAKAIKALKKAMGPQPRVPEQDSKKVLTGKQPQPQDVRERQKAKV